ncbi:hypothetical protein AA103196_3124 [Ameyamaea chiangmaiensis NBRC 103196]|uniref:Uncharacterized protein n=1 Tax=Ameyamaea chiangmaiensis TaxID=442969 RepID=A0A850PAL2_9PROT|nr:hypothetical protein [Ameyamaea chiangmaiensis]MBS4074610.1 hypothetical protein [Ameyamaea chiangmaiensis]NVN39366.1 hypothetical protein [Ameyamaea chiangmaiensis]GBQ72655.1 hypothetical protein AA103196_3124 [Ameyamaea chiangmaiensis NBRC 103196]
MAQAIILPTSSGYLQLGHKLTAGIQTSIENFLTFDEAESFGVKNGIALKYWDNTRAWRREDVVALHSVSGLSAHDTAMKIGYSLGRVISFAMRAESFGAVSISRSGKRAEWALARTHLGDSLIDGWRVSDR